MNHPENRGKHVHFGILCSVLKSIEEKLEECEKQTGGKNADIFDFIPLTRNTELFFSYELGEKRLPNQPFLHHQKVKKIRKLEEQSQVA